jgi:DNA-binding transcriptional MocR family regulator
MSEERKKDIAKVIRGNDLMLIEDDAEAFMTYGYVDGCGEPLYTLVPERTVYICRVVLSSDKGYDYQNELHP